MNRLEIKNTLGTKGSLLFDIFINGKPLSYHIKGVGGLCILNIVPAEAPTRYLQIFRLEEESDFKPERIPLYVCEECGEYGCGVTTVAIERISDRIVWKDFQFEHPFDFEPYVSRNLGTHRFDFEAESYLQTFSPGTTE